MSRPPAKPKACSRCGALPALRTLEGETADGVKYDYVYQCTRCHYRPDVYSDTPTHARMEWNKRMDAIARMQG